MCCGARFGRSEVEGSPQHPNLRWRTLSQLRTSDVTLTPETPIHLDGSRAKRVLGFKPTKPRVEVNELRKISQGFQKDKIW